MLQKIAELLVDMVLSYVYVVKRQVFVVEREKDGVWEVTVRKMEPDIYLTTEEATGVQIVGAVIAEENEIVVGPI